MIAELDTRTSPRAAGQQGVVVYGDFGCPWSYLAFRRARVLVDAGLDVDWRAVEHDPWRPRRGANRSCRFTEVQQEMDRVLALLLPGESLPYDLAGFVPSTEAAVSAYAEARIAGTGHRVATVIFESFWMHGVDIGQAPVLRSVLVDQLRGSSSPSEAVREWGYPTDLTGGPISTAAWRLVVRWASEWQSAEKRVVPMVVRSDGEVLHGVDAVQWLGDQIVACGIPPDTVLREQAAATAPFDRRELPDLGWVAATGGRWSSRSQAAASAR